MHGRKRPAPARRAWLAGAGVILLVATLSSCEAFVALSELDAFQVRVPIQDVNAGFELADATWFEEEQTLFIFYSLRSEQGLGDLSQIELAFRTDEREQDYQVLETFPVVHEHLRAACGARTLCGSWSTPVELEPRDVRLRLRYHRDGEVFLDADVAEHVVATGPPSTNRSALVYGVFDETNTRVSWRLRHQFPAIRNQQAQSLGLRRELAVEDVTYGALLEDPPPFAPNPYGYGLLSACPPDFSDLDVAPVTTIERSVWSAEMLPTDTYDLPHFCGTSTVTDATGMFTAIVFAQKNVESRSAFPALESPIREATQLRFFLEVCDDGTTELHRAMMMQRLFLTEADVICIDDWPLPDFSERLATRFQERINTIRAAGDDMVLVLGLARPGDAAIAAAVERALALVVPDEGEQPSPRLAGAFVFDSEAYSQSLPETVRRVLWCPSSFGGDELMAINDVSVRSCAVQPVQPLELGPVRLASLPILPTRDQHADFVDRYGEAQTGRMTDLTFLAPLRTTTSEDVPIQDFGVATFFNEEAITPEPQHAFSYCAGEDSGAVVFRVPGFPDLFPLAVLGELHSGAMLTRYELGLFWDFPYLLQLDYLNTLAAAGDVTQIDAVIAFGQTSPAEQFLGAPQWQQGRFDISRALEQCTKFCDHPTFDSAGVYNVLELFRESYATRCYSPRFPSPDDDGFPLDP